MSGHNHYADCNCGWCLKFGGSGIRKPVYMGQARAPTFVSYASFTVPNASCPVCGAAVFFYQSPSGGRVFFDELGPPWPKHDCTDNTILSASIKGLAATPRTRKLAWRKEGWEPVRIRRSRMEGSWHVVPVENLITRLHFDVLTSQVLNLTGETCASMMRWNENGWSIISYVELEGRAEEITVPIFEKKRYSRTNCIATVLHRQKIR